MSTPYDPDKCCVVLFTKPARPGRVKTRLIGELSASEAAELHAAFLADTRELLAGGAFQLRIAWALEEGEALPEEPGVHLRQEGKDLGERLFRTLRRTADDYPWVAAVGSDHPELSLAAVEAGFRHLAAGVDMVIGPSRDGGYYLIGLSAAAVDEGIFEGIAWSTRTVLLATLRRARELGLSTVLLPSGRDVDTPADLAGLSRRLSRGAAGCPRTRRLLRDWGRLRQVAE